MPEIRTASSDTRLTGRPERSKERRPARDLPRWAVYLAFAGFCAAMWALAFLIVFAIV